MKSTWHINSWIENLDNGERAVRLELYSDNRREFTSIIQFDLNPSSVSDEKKQYLAILREKLEPLTREVYRTCGSGWVVESEISDMVAAHIKEKSGESAMSDHSLPTPPHFVR